MASQEHGKKVDPALVIDEDKESSMGEDSPDRVLPLDALMSLLPERKEDHEDIPGCAWDTIEGCITEVTVRLAFESANTIAQDKRKVITVEDVERAIERLSEKDPGPGVVIQEMNAIVAAERRAIANWHRQQWRLREKLADGHKAKGQDGASGAGLRD